MPTLIGAAMIAAAILLSTFINTLGSRYVGFEGPTDEAAWLVDRLTGSAYKCLHFESGTPHRSESDYIAARCPARLNPAP